MRLVIKLLISLCIIVACTLIAKKLPSMAGLIAVMPLTGALVMIWVYMDNPANANVMIGYTKGALWGIIPVILFYITAFFCFRSQLNLWVTLLSSFAVWTIAAFIHQYLLRT
ncbi:MAG: DUF3147 family protein [Sedimentisphaerales bacterium]|nr:DUF3147 family protein [Sedimentisphaerales bacterium]